MSGRNLIPKVARTFHTVKTVMASGKESTPRLASTVLVCRPKQVTTEDSDYEVLFVKRKMTARFMAGYHVFPGGIVEESDHLPENHPLGSKNEDKLLQVMKMAAVREVFEESNILLCDPVVSVENMAKWRPIVLKDCTKFNEMCSELGCKPSYDSLLPWTRWITPEQERFRYDTYFFLAVVKDRQLDAKHDQLETTDFDWLSPVDAIKSYEAGTVLLAPPTYLILSELAGLPTFKSVKRVAKNGRTLDHPIMPVIDLSPERVLLYLPGDQNSTKPFAPNYLRRLSFAPGGKFEHITTDPNDKLWNPYPSIPSSKL